MDKATGSMIAAAISGGWALVGFWGVASDRVHPDWLTLAVLVAATVSAVYALVCVICVAIWESK